MAGPTRILLLEDEPVQAMQLLRTLALEGREVRTVNRLRAAQELVAGWWPDLAILDLGLPDGDGLELCRTLRAGPPGAAVRIIVLTGEGVATSEKVRAFEAGADEYLVKPVPPVEMAARVRSLLQFKQAEEALKAAMNAADAANQAKSAFLANMSHEIRTPLNALLGFLQLLQGTGLSPKQQDYLDKAGGSARQLHGLLSDLLDFSRIEAGPIELEEAPFDLRQVLGTLVETLSVRAADKGLRLAADLAPDLPARVVGDARRLGQVLLNLGNNAIKFTEIGEVRIAVRVLEHTRRRVRLGLEVRDTGIGMTEAQVGSLFQPFTQGDGSTTRRFGGTGLGLAVSQRLAQLMGGAITVASQPGQGSSFSLELAFPVAEGQIAAGPEPPVPPAAALPLAGIAVLLAEDNDLNQQVAKEILRRAGAAVTLAGDGREALARLREQRFDAVLMDLQMPGMGGLAAAREIRRNPLWEDLPIIALTADTLEDAGASVLAAGMNACISKPIQPNLLVQAIAGQIRRAGPGDEPAQGLDIPAACARLGLEPETYLRFLRRFGAGQDALLAGLRAALEQGDRDSALRQLHSLKGAALNLGLVPVGGAARDLETLLRKGGWNAWELPLARIRDLLREVGDSLAPEPQLLDAVPEQAAPDWPAILASLETLGRALRQDDARAGHDLAALERLLQGRPLREALAPMKGPIEAYDYGRALALFPAFLAQVEGQRDAGT